MELHITILHAVATCLRCLYLHFHCQGLGLIALATQFDGQFQRFGVHGKRDAVLCGSQCRCIAYAITHLAHSLDDGVGSLAVAHDGSDNRTDGEVLKIDGIIVYRGLDGSPSLLLVAIEERGAFSGSPLGHEHLALIGSIHVLYGHYINLVIIIVTTRGKTHCETHYKRVSKQTNRFQILHHCLFCLNFLWFYFY